MTPEETAQQEAERAAAAEAKAKADAEAKNLHRPNERTEKEKAEYTLRKNAERVAELGGNPADVLNIRPQINLDSELADDTPLTVGNFRELQKQDAQKTALQMADELPEDERDEVKALLQTRIVPSGNAEEDLRLARAAVNAPRNAKIAELLATKGTPKRTAPGASADAKVEDQFTPTPEESRMMQPPYNVSKEKIIAARQRAQQ